MANLYEIRERAQRAGGGIQQAPSSPPARDYSAIYRAIIAYHERHNPPRLTAEYWQEAVEDISRVSCDLDNDPFAIALLSAVLGEMERAYKILEAEGGGEP